MDSKNKITLNHPFYEGTKKCKKCKRDLPNNYLYFPADKQCKTGLRNICRECDKSYKNFLDENYKPLEKWTDEEITILISEYKNYSGKELVEKFFPNRTVKAVESYAHFLKIAQKSEDCRQKRYENLGKLLSKKFTGRVVSDETRKIIPELRIEYYKTHESVLKGKKLSEERCLQISERSKGRWVGDKNPRHKNPLFGDMNGRWQGRLNEIIPELRSFISEWKDNSMEFCNYKCIITGNGFDNVHHVISFKEIFKQVFENTKIEQKSIVSNYSKEELNILREEIKQLHDYYGYGACINKSIHKLFHDTYGYMNFTIDDFINFIDRIKNGDFDNWFKENNLSININWDFYSYILNKKMEISNVTKEKN